MCVLFVYLVCCRLFNDDLKPKRNDVYASNVKMHLISCCSNTLPSKRNFGHDAVNPSTLAIVAITISFQHLGLYLNSLTNIYKLSTNWNWTLKVPVAFICKSHIICSFRLPIIFRNRENEKVRKRKRESSYRL